MDNSAFQKIRKIDFPENSPRPPGNIRPRMFRQAMIKDRDNNIYAVYGDRLKKGKSTTENRSPWDITLTGVGQPNNEGKYSSYEASVWPGLLGGSLPNNIFQKFTVQGNGTQYLVASVNTNGKTVVSSSIDFTSIPATLLTPLLGAAPTNIEITLGIAVDGNPFNLYGQSLGITPMEVFRENNPTAGPFEIPWNSWWSWAIQADHSYG